MGVILSRLRKKPSAKELIEEVEKEIEVLEEYKRSVEQQQKHLVGSLILYSIIFYIIGAAVFFLYYFPASLHERIIYSIPLLAFPILVWLLKQLLHWYFVQKLKNNDEQLRELKRKKKSLIEFAMETETYKVVKELLDKYDPEFPKRLNEERRAIEGPKATDFDLRRRNIANRSAGSPIPLPASPGGTLSLTPAGQGMPLHSLSSSPGKSLPQSPFNPQFLQRNGQQWVRPPVPQQMPRPILPRERTILDRIVDYLVGDGPSSRYALICRQCQSHNGMALREEFDFVAFRCCYCFHWNPARSQQPPAPRLSLPPAPITSGEPTITEPPSDASISEEDTEAESISDAHSSDEKRSRHGSQSDQYGQSVIIEENTVGPGIEEIKPHTHSPSGASSEQSVSPDKD